MGKFFMIFALASSAALAQTQALPEPNPPMVPAVRPPQGPASRAARHEDLARERALRLAEKAEDRADAQRKQAETDRKLRDTQR